MSNFKINDKVVCVDDRTTSETQYRLYPNGRPAKGEVFCVAASCISFRGVPIIRLVGKPAVDTRDGEECGYMAECFRLVSEVKAENQAKRAARATGKEPQP